MCNDCRNTSRRARERGYYYRKVASGRPHYRGVRPRGTERQRAGKALRNAVRDGRVVKPSLCSQCGSETPPRRLHGHHHDYSMPLEVTWLCYQCHAVQHRLDAALSSPPPAGASREEHTHD
jgi:hypothetical protein